MNRRLLLIILSVLVAVALAGCDVHQFPDEPDVPVPEPLKVVLELDFSTELPLHTVVTYPDNSMPDVMSRSADEAGDYLMRHTIKIYDNTGNGNRSTFTRAEELYTFEEFTEPGYEETRRIEIALPDGEYTALVWSDHVRRDDPTVMFYDPSDFEGIVFNADREYEGNTEWRDAFRGEVDFYVPDPDTEDGTVQTVVVPMVRPLAKLSVIATDVRRFISRANAQNAAKGGSRDLDPETYDFSDYYARMVYTGYLPSTFNMHANKPVDSKLGVSFPSEIQAVDSENACLAFDYVMVNGSEAKVNAAIQILNRKDEVVAQSSSFVVPLMRSKLTEVRGKFLTATAQGGIGINPDYDGEFNIFIP